MGAGGFQDAEQAPFGIQDVRYTRRGETLYAVLLAPADDRPVRLRALATEAGGVREGVRAVTVLGAAGEVEWMRDADALEVTLPPGMRDGLPPGPVTVRVEQGQ